MRIALFGISGRIGQAIVHVAERRWIEVTGLARPGARVAPAINLTLLRGELNDSRSVLAALDGADAACIAFAPRPPYRQVFCAHATARIILGMRTARVSRLICQSCALVGELPETLSPLLQLKARAFNVTHQAVAADRALQEDAVRSSGLQWTLVKPCRVTTKPMEEKAKVAYVPRFGLFSSIGRDSVATFVVDELQRPRFLRKVVYLGG